MSVNSFYPHTEREQLAPLANKRVLVIGKVQHIAAWMSGKRWGLRANLVQCKVKYDNIQVDVNHFTVNVGKQFIAVRAKRNTTVSFYATVKAYQPDKQLKYVQMTSRSHSDLHQEYHHMSSSGLQESRWSADVSTCNSKVPYGTAV